METERQPGSFFFFFFTIFLEIINQSSSRLCTFPVQRLTCLFSTLPLIDSRAEMSTRCTCSTESRAWRTHPLDSGPMCPARNGKTQPMSICPVSTFKVSWKVGSTVFFWTPVLRLPWEDLSGSR